MKGITPIIAIIVLLLITVAIAGAAWTYINVYVSGMYSKSIEVTDAYCTGGNTANILVRNSGTEDITIASDLSVLDASTGAVPTGGTWETTGGVPNPLSVAPNSVVIYKIACTGMCNYRVVASGRSTETTVRC